MRGLQVALLVLAVNTFVVEALKCRICQDQDNCAGELEECGSSSDVCATITISSPGTSIIKGCLTSLEVELLSGVAHCKVVTCSSDLCN